MGPAEAVMYAVDTERLGKTGRAIPSYLDLEVHLGKDSMFNTPAVFSVYTTMLTLRWLKAKGGVAAIQRENEAKSSLLYTEIDRNALFTGHAQPDNRSHMNVTFRLNDDTHAEAFDAAWSAANISGLKGTELAVDTGRSMYNALPLDSVQVLVDVMHNLSAHKADFFSKPQSQPMNILANDGISPSGEQALRDAGHTLFTDFIDADQLESFIHENAIDGILVRSATKVRLPLIGAYSTLKFIGRGGVGMDNIDVEYARNQGLTVFNTPAASSQSVAELVMGHLFSLARFNTTATGKCPPKAATNSKA